MSKRHPLALALISIGLVSSPLCVNAEEASPLSFNVGVNSDYLFRGISQTHGKPSISAGVDYAHSSGLYVGAWASNVTWVKDWLGKGKVEIDVYGGYKKSFGDFGTDVGVIAYNYPGSGDAIKTYLAKPDTQELYLGGSWKWLSAKYSHTLSKNFVGWYTPDSSGTANNNSRGSNYLELNANYDLGNGWGLIGHVGKQKVKGSSKVSAGDGSTTYENANYVDWKIGVSKDVGFGVFTLAWSDTNAKGTCDGSNGGTSVYCWGKLQSADRSIPDAKYSSYRDVAKGTAVLSFSKTF
jgi:uncharacterized protein (TIGR02001 family)